MPSIVVTFQAAASQTRAGQVIVWNGVGSALTSDNVKCTTESNPPHATPLDGPTSYLVVTDPSETLPDGAVLTGMKLYVERRDSQGLNFISDGAIYYVSGNVVASGTTNKASATLWPGTDTVAEYGGDGDLWGGSLAASSIDSGFGFAISADFNPSEFESGDAEIDYVYGELFFTLGESTATEDPEAAKIKGFLYSTRRLGRTFCKAVNNLWSR